MPLTKQDLIFGGILGAILGLAYQLWRAHSAGGIETASLTEFVAAAAIGAIAGIAAFVIRRLAS